MPRFVESRAWLGALGILALAAAAHAPALRADFLWDDEFWLWDSPLTLAPDGLLRAWLSADRLDYYPLTASAFWIQWRLWGNSPLGYHAVNVLLHGLGAVLVWRWLLALRVPGAWAAAAVFAVHPVTVGSVAWITQLKNTLSLVFYAGAGLAWVRFLDAEEGRRGRPYAATLVLGAAALLSKSSTVVLPIVLLAIARARRGLRRRDLLAGIPLFAMALVSSAATVWFQANRAFGKSDLPAEDVAARIVAAGRAVWFYLGKVVAPVDLAIIYPRWDPAPSSPAAWAPTAGLVVLLVAAAVAARRRPRFGKPVLLGLGVFVVTLLPVLGFFDMYYLRYSRVADHWQYLALPAAIALLVGGAAAVGRRLPPRARNVGPVVVAVVLVVLGTLTFRQARLYRDHGTFWGAIVQRDPEAWVAWNGLGMWAGRRGDHEAAARDFARAVELNPDYALAWHNLGLAQERAGEPEPAEASYERALAIRPDWATARADLGRLLAQQGRMGEGIDHLREAVRLQPLHVEARFNLAVASMQAGDLPAASEQLGEVVRLAPDHLRARYILAKALVQRGDLAGAATQLREVIRRDAGYEDAAAALEAVTAALGSDG